MDDQDEACKYSSMAGKIDASLLKSLDAMNYHTMTPVQQKVLISLPNWTSDWYVDSRCLNIY